jgi:hypothetical protein
MGEKTLRSGTAFHMVSPNSEGNGQIGRAWARVPNPRHFNQPRLAVSATQVITAAGLYKSPPSPIYNVHPVLFTRLFGPMTNNAPPTPVSSTHWTEVHLTLYHSANPRLSRWE